MIFFIFPFQREQSQKIRKQFAVNYALTTILLALSIAVSIDNIPPWNYPELATATRIYGVITRHPTNHGSKYASEKLGIRVDGEDLYFNVSEFGARYWTEDDWRRYQGKPAEVWHHDSWILQVMIDGVIPNGMSHDRIKRKRLFSVSISLWILFTVGLVISVTAALRNYMKPALADIAAQKYISM